MECPYKNECATVIYWSKEKAQFIREVCDTDKHEECLHYFASLKPQHEERQRLYGDPHAHEPDWNKIGKKMKPNEIIHDMQAEREVCGLGCAGKTKEGKNCKRYIIGSQNGFYFTHKKLGTCDIRNEEWRCYQHINKGEIECANPEKE